jgi:hypothetical protein
MLWVALISRHSVRTAERGCAPCSHGSRSFLQQRCGQVESVIAPFAMAYASMRPRCRRIRKR